MKQKNEDRAPPPFAVRLPQELQERLRRAGGARGIGEEIRRRLEASFEAEKPPAKTRELVDAISYAAEETATYYGQWVEDAFAFEVLKACVDLLLRAYQPKGEVRPSPDHSEVAEIFFGPEHLPEDISRFIVRDLMRAREKIADEGKRR